MSIVVIGVTSRKFYRDEFHRFEGMSNPDDNSIVFAISSNDGIKGTLVDAYGMYADSLTESMIKKLALNISQLLHFFNFESRFLNRFHYFRFAGIYR